MPDLVRVYTTRGGDGCRLRAIICVQFCVCAVMLLHATSNEGVVH